MQRAIVDRLTRSEAILDDHRPLDERFGTDALRPKYEAHCQLQQSFRVRMMQEGKARSLFGVIEKWLPVLTVVVGAIWGLYTYLDHQKELERDAIRQANAAAATRSFEMRKPFLDKQLALYFEVVAVSGYLATENDPQLVEWKQKIERFSQLYYGELPMVCSQNVDDAMRNMWMALLAFEQSPETVTTWDLKTKASQALAQAIHKDIEGVWQTK